MCMIKMKNSMKFYGLFICFGFDIQAICNHYVTPLENTLSSTVQAGDTICIEGSTWESPLVFTNLIGQENQWITIINNNENVTFDTPSSVAIEIKNSQYVHLSGVNSESSYGIKIIHSLGKGVKIWGNSSNIEVNNLDIAGVTFQGKSAAGIWYNGTNSLYPVDGINIHNNYIHDVEAEAIYVGDSSYYSNFQEAKNIKIYNNITKNTGWDGIQVGSARLNCAIYNNSVLKDSQLDNSSQNTGINVNAGSICDVYNNIIIDGKGTGIQLNSTIGGKVYNNLIVNAGIGSSTSDGEAIKVNKNSNESPDIIKIYNNTIINPKRHGIAYYDNNEIAYYIQNNILVDIGENAINGSSRPNGVISHNIIGTISELNFVNPSINNFHLNAQSIAINKGIDTQLTYDLDLVQRDSIIDVGAYEFTADKKEFLPAILYYLF